LAPYLNATLLDEEIDKVLATLDLRISERLPAAYITNEAHFLGYTFYIDKRTIIPRSFIAEIILNNGLNSWIEHPELVNNILDLCTGNGSLAVIAAEHFYASQVTAIDIDDSALEVAKINVERHNLTDRVQLVKSDLFTQIEAQEQFDLIITNPPYVDQRRMDELPAEYLHEPQLALAGGTDGLVLVKAILLNAANYLSEYGILVLEMGDNQEELEELFPGLPFTWSTTETGEGFVFVLTKADLSAYFI
jgi:ribosomal protein L3 glutamine methyltransferase